MPAWRRLARGIRALVDRAGTDRDVADEVDHYLAESAAAHEGRGLSPGEARRAARLEMGGVTASPRPRCCWPPSGSTASCPDGSPSARGK